MDWTINIKQNPTPPPRVVFEFSQPPDVQVDDQIIWTNRDTQAHWPGLADDPQFFFDAPIKGAGEFGPVSSSAFVPGEEGTINYVCTLHKGETGVINVKAAPGKE